MGIRQKVKVRGGAAVAVAAVLSLTLAGCGGGDEKPTKEAQKSAASQPQGSGAQKPSPTGGGSSEPLEVIATSAGPAGIVLTLNSAVRDQGGFLTVSGQIKNGGSDTFVRVTAWKGDEKGASATSVAGATLTDKAGKKRYYVLRDTEGRCLCTIGITKISAGETIPFFAQFPAPPAGTTEVDFNLPTFATATIKVSG
ncbi:hypothetical protein EES41_22980 [Streptomyces sp. ADI95-16]|uniref:hypothetical protein n=1 Tax=Streptomyces sp. ADI95-16 TaxID=1522758 RepID=UPI000F3A9D67|nr:hypothetical protein [Streptomyces sp. ADI95-16]AYV29582.1 hypothetical protein EES41_22980 [Streptomyces sp. ADI95-16]